MNIKSSLMTATAAIAAALAFNSASAAPLAEPPVFSSLNGLLDIVMIAQEVQGAGGNTGVKGWAYTTCFSVDATNTKVTLPTGGSAVVPTCTGKSTQTQYGGVRLSLTPGDRLKIKFRNNLPTLNTSIAGLPKSRLPAVTTQIAYLYQDPLLVLNPTNLHTHGLVVDARPNTSLSGIPVYGDFIYTSIFNPANGSPTAIDPLATNPGHSHGDVVPFGVAQYDILIPKNHPLGTGWIHAHTHGLTLNHLSSGLSSIITIGKASSYECGDDSCTKPITETNVRHLILKDMQLVTQPGGKFTPLLQEDPDFCGAGLITSPSPNGSCPGIGAYAGGQWNFPINGQLYPSIPVATAEGEVWRLTNSSSVASYRLQWKMGASGYAMPVQILSIDGISVSFPTGANAGQVIQLGKNRFTLASCGKVSESYKTQPVCASEIIMMVGTRVELHVAARDINGNRLKTALAGNLITAGLNTGGAIPANGDQWPPIQLATVSIPAGSPTVVKELVHVVNGAAESVRSTGGIFQAAVPGAVDTPVPSNCKALPTGWKRRVYFANLATTGPSGQAEFGLGYELVDSLGVVRETQEIAKYDPTQVICVPLAKNQMPVVETWEIINLATELHNFHIHQTRFRLIDPNNATPASSLLSAAAVNPGMLQDSVPLPVATNTGVSDCGSIADYKAGKCKATTITTQIPFAKLGKFVMHCHILEHEDGGMMRAVGVVPWGSTVSPLKISALDIE